jgi:SAM-dependent methyltransferase
MTTIRPEPETPSPQETRHWHTARKVAESFGVDAERYDRARPSYPQALVDRIVAASPGREVLDVGCGTGADARQFQSVGCTVLGVEPDERMARLARRGGLDVDVAKFEDWDDAGRLFDAVVAAQAWHWVDPGSGTAKAARMLRPDGLLALFWNAFQPPPDMTKTFAEIYDRVATGLPFNPWARPPLESYLAMCDRAAAEIREANAFREPQRWQFDWSRPYTRDEWLEQVPTFGGHSLIEPDTLKKLLAGIGEALDAAGGGFVMNYATVAVTAVRADGA